MNRIDRLFGIITLLQSRRYVPAETIAGRFNISIRTVYRDIKAICEQGIPVSFEPNRGYFVVQGFFLPPVSFSREEAAALLLMETMVPAFADKSIEKHYSSALQKVKAVLPERELEHIETLNQNTRLQVPACMQHDQEYLAAIQAAISGRRLLDMEYENSKKEKSRRLVEPIGLVYYAFSWHLIAWCHLRNEYRDFKVLRIVSLRLTHEPFRQQKHMELTEYMQQLPVDF